MRAKELKIKREKEKEATKTDLKTSKWKSDQGEATTKCADNMYISIHINK